MSDDLPPRMVVTEAWLASVEARLAEIGKKPAWLARALTKKLRRKVHPSQVSRMLNQKGHSTFLVAPTCELLGIPVPDQADAIEGNDTQMTAPTPPLASRASERVAGWESLAMQALRTIDELDQQSRVEITTEILSRALQLSEEERKKR